MAGLRSYAQYGPQNPFNNVLSDAELDALKAEDLVNILHDLFNFKHKVLYYGPKTGNDVTAALKPIHKLPATLKELPKTKKHLLRSQRTKTKYCLHITIWYRLKYSG